MNKEISDGSTANYYQLPDISSIQDLFLVKSKSAVGRIFSICYTYGEKEPNYMVPAGSTELQDLISYKNLNAQIGEIIRACFRYGKVAHSTRLRDAKKIRFYAEAELSRLKKYEPTNLYEIGDTKYILKYIDEEIIKQELYEKES